MPKIYSLAPLLIWLISSLAMAMEPYNAKIHVENSLTMANSSDGKVIIVVQKNQILIIDGIYKSFIKFDRKKYPKKISAVAVNGRLAMIGTSRGHVAVIDLKGKEILARFPDEYSLFMSGVRRVAISDDGTRGIVLLDDRSLIILNIQAKAIVDRLRVREDEEPILGVNSLSISPDNNTAVLAVSRYNGGSSLDILNLETLEYESVRGSFSEIDITKDSRFVIHAASYKGGIFKTNIKTGICERIDQGINELKNSVENLKIIRENFLVTIQVPGKEKIWDLRDGSLVKNTQLRGEHYDEYYYDCDGTIIIRKQSGDILYTEKKPEFKNFKIFLGGDNILIKYK